MTDPKDQPTPLRNDRRSSFWSNLWTGVAGGLIVAVLWPFFSPLFPQSFVIAVDNAIVFSIGSFWKAYVDGTFDLAAQDPNIYVLDDISSIIYFVFLMAVIFFMMFYVISSVRGERKPLETKTITRIFAHILLYLLSF
jgi:hypothetical protein